MSSDKKKKRESGEAHNPEEPGKKKHKGTTDKGEPLDLIPLPSHMFCFRNYKGKKKGKQTVDTISERDSNIPSKPGSPMSEFFL